MDVRLCFSFPAHVLEIVVEELEILGDQERMLLDQAKDLLGIAVGAYRHGAVAPDAEHGSVVCEDVPGELVEPHRKDWLAALKKPLLNPFLNASRANRIRDNFTAKKTRVLFHHLFHLSR
jgi:hypothetical protein